MHLPLFYSFILPIEIAHKKKKKKRSLLARPFFIRYFLGCLNTLALRIYSTSCTFSRALAIRAAAKK